MQRQFTVKSKKDKIQSHIINGKLVENFFINPFHSSLDKKFLVDIIMSKLDKKIKTIDNKNRFFIIEEDGRERFFCIDTMDHGGRHGSFKFEIPFSNKFFVNALVEEKLISIVNVFLPLKTQDDINYEIDEENIVISILNPTQIFSAKGYAQAMEGFKKINSSSRWISFDKIYKIYKSKAATFTKPDKARMADGSYQYIYSTSLETFDEKALKVFDRAFVSVPELIKQYQDESEKFTGKSTTKIMAILNKFQKTFRDDLLRGDKKRCAIEGCKEHDIKNLIASHIMDKKYISKNDALDITDKIEYAVDSKNGFLLCRNHDNYFDRKLVSFDRNGKVVLSEKYVSSNATVYNGTENIIFDIFKTKNNIYLNYHSEATAINKV